MEKQMRLEDKQFYQERIIEFENKMIDLRKYLHDKEESFTSVIIRLKKY
jgi:phosphopantetheine adenylyltransferase